MITSGTGYQSPLHNSSDVRSACTDGDVAWFMLHVERGAFLICNGWDPSFGKMKKNAFFCKGPFNFTCKKHIRLPRQARDVQPTVYDAFVVNR